MSEFARVRDDDGIASAGSDGAVANAPTNYKK